MPTFMTVGAAAGARAAGHPATGSRADSGVAGRLDTGYNRLNMTGREKRSLVKQRAHATIFIARNHRFCAKLLM